jgi:outer membrane receptor protein involved in Fe transport
VTYDLTEKWSVTGGARWFEYDRQEVELSFVPEGLPSWDPETQTTTGGRIESSGTDSDTVFKFGTQYKFDDDRMVYFIYSEGFRLGGQNAARAAATGLIEPTYKPDKLENYEIGLKSTWLDDRLQFNFSAFLMEWKDFQLNVGTDIYWARGIFNGNDAEQQGIESDFIWNVTPNFVLEGSVFLGDPEFSEETVLPSFDPDDPQPDDVIQAGTPLPLSPERKYHVAAEYTIPSFVGWNGDLWTRLSYSYQSDTWKDLDAAIERDPTQNIPSWWTSDLQLGFSHNNGWDATLIIRNLFDEKGINWLSASDWGTTFNDPRFNYVRTLQQPRTISLAFSKKW